MRTVALKHSAEALWAIYGRSTCAVQRRRSQLLALLAEGRNASDVLAITRYSRQGADKIIDAYHAEGLDGLQDRRHGNTGAPSLLSDGELLWLARRVRATSDDLWSGRRVQDELRAQFGKTVHLSRCYEFLDAVGYSRQKPRPRHVDADPVAQETFKKRRSPKLSAQWQRVLAQLSAA